MPVPARSIASDGDTNSLMSQATTIMTAADSLPAQIVRLSAKKGFTFNLMSVGPSGLGKTTLISAIFGKNLSTPKEDAKKQLSKDQLDPPIEIDAKTFEISDTRVPLKLTVVNCNNYGKALRLKETHLPVVEYIDDQFADYLRQAPITSSRKIQDKMIHCMFFFISPIGHGLSKFDIEFLKAVQGRVNIIPIISQAETFTGPEKVSFKRRVKNDLEKHNIKIYEMPDPDPEDSDDMKRTIKEIQENIPFAVTSMILNEDNTLSGPAYEWGRIDPFDREHSDYLLLRTMINLQMPDLCENTLEVFYENFRIRSASEQIKYTK